ncbi:hypothetical protein HDF13_001393 [Edaphobacter lichenicola]|uniref:Uncharacterized protein n=1 Tax=Tunturiibacter gelidiferens TaxID=3069689 RepID=A0ACC5NWW5_9BACT|nr:hypothetical protein [Edaphobacter lichenicola]
MIRFDNKPKKQIKTKTSLIPRLFLVAGGCACILIGVNQIHRNVLVYRNGYLQTVYAGGAIGTGALFILFAFLPAGDWIYRRITTRPQLHEPQYSSRRSRLHKTLTNDQNRKKEKEHNG